MKLTSMPALLLVLNLSASVAFDQHLRVRQMTTTNTTDASNSTVSPSLSLAPTVSLAPTNSTAPSPAPTTAAPTESSTNEPTTGPTNEPTHAPTVWDCPEDYLVPNGTWDDYWWSELPSCVQEAARVFGYNENKWDHGIDSCPSFCDEWWKDLTSKQKEAARVFGYNKQRWNNGR